MSKILLKVSGQAKGHIGVFDGGISMLSRLSM